MSLIKDCMKKKIEILTSQAVVTHALDFVEMTKAAGKRAVQPGYIDSCGARQGRKRWQ